MPKKKKRKKKIIKRKILKTRKKKIESFNSDTIFDSTENKTDVLFIDNSEDVADTEEASVDSDDQPQQQASFAGFSLIVPFAPRSIPIPQPERPFFSKRLRPAQGLISTVLFFIFASLFIFQGPWGATINQELVIKTVTVKQISSATAGGSPVQWTLLVKKSDITNQNYLAQLPKRARNIKIITVSQQQAQDVLKIKPAEELSLKQKNSIAVANQPKSFFTAGLLDSIGKYFKAELNDAVQAVIDTVTPEIQPTSDATAVDLSAAAPVETPTEEVVKVDYQTPAPEITTQPTDTGALVTVSAPTETPDQPRLTDVLAFTKIPEIFKVGQEDKIKIKWKNNGNQDITFHAYDTDNNGKLDYVEWTVPHLSEQIFEIIFISKAFRLDSDKNIIEDIYATVKTQDGTYATINSGEYVRVTFEQILDNTKDITLYAKSDSGARVEVYAENGTELVATFENIDHDGKYRILLSNLSTPTDVFDLKIVGNIDIDYIVDPATCPGSMSGTGVLGDECLVTSWTTLDAVRNDLTLYYVLQNNLTASDGDYIANFTPIGNSATPFTGNFDGTNHTISGLVITLPATDRVGLFGSSTGNISNIGLIDVNVSGNINVGGLVGYSSGTVSNSYSTGSISAGNYYAGGLIGSQAIGGAISNSYSTGDVTAPGGAGGLVALFFGTISDSYSTGDVVSSDNVGGLAGWQVGTGTISNSYSTGNVVGSGNVGGLLGRFTLGGAVTNSYWDKETSGQTTSAGGTGKTTAEMKKLYTYNSNGGNWDITGGATDLNSGYPYLSMTGSSPIWLILNNEASLNTAPTLTSIADSPDPIIGGNQITITPTGQGDTESSALYYYCAESTAPTSANTLCSQANASYTSPYSTMTCAYNVTTGDVTRTVYCRTYDGTDYSTEWTTTYNVISCGDGTCNGSETCGTCPADCGGGCGGTSHTECSAQKCISVPGSGTNQCTNDDECKITCSADTDCGTNGYGSPFCKDGNVYQYAYTCSSPGEIGSSCVESATPTLKTTCSAGQTCYEGVCAINVTCHVATDCGTNGFSAPFCKDGNVYQYAYTCSSPGEVGSSCVESPTPQEKTICTDKQKCVDGACVNQSIACSSAADCQAGGYTGSSICGQDNNVHQNYITWTCDNAGTISSSCKNSTADRLKISCLSNQTCNNGSCVTATVPIVPVLPGEGDTGTGDGGGGGVGGGGTPSPIIDVITQPVKTIETVANTVVQQISEPVKVVAEQTKKIVETPEGSAITKTVSTTGLVVATAAAAGSLFTFSFFELFLIPLRLFALLLTALGLKKRIIPWGLVYDSVTKRPLDPAYVILRDLQGKEISTAITDLDGRYGFLVGPGVYQIQAHKTNYIFPSQKLAGKMNDELHENLYFGGNIEIKAPDEVIIKNIPLDPVKFDWNEFAKKDKNLMKFYSKWDIVLRKIYDFIFVIGFIVAVIAYVFAPYPYNAIIIFLYLLSLVLRIFGFKPKSYGYIVDKTTGVPISFAIIRVVAPGRDGQTGIEIASKSADKYGKYYCLVPPGKYLVKIEKKNEDGSYSLAYTSSVIDVSRKGIIKDRFAV